MSDKPIRIQRKRIKGFRMPPNTIYVGRGSRWGNPYRVGVDGNVMECIRKYHDDINPYRHHGKTSSLEHFYISEANIRDIQISLRGKNLACWCPIISHDVYCPCHADMLISIANDLTMEEVINENLRWTKRKAVT